MKSIEYLNEYGSFYEYDEAVKEQYLLDHADEDFDRQRDDAMDEKETADER